MFPLLFNYQIFNKKQLVLDEIHQVEPSPTVGENVLIWGEVQSASSPLEAPNLTQRTFK